MIVKGIQYGTFVIHHLFLLLTKSLMPFSYFGIIKKMTASFSLDFQTYYSVYFPVERKETSILHPQSPFFVTQLKSNFCIDPITDDTSIDQLQDSFIAVDSHSQTLDKTYFGSDQRMQHMPISEIVACAVHHVGIFVLRPQLPLCTQFRIPQMWILFMLSPRNAHEGL